MKKNSILTILIGIPASGKSTFADEYVKTHKKAIRVSRDDFRYMWKAVGFCDFKIEELITKEVRHQIKKFLRLGYDVLYDATNVKAAYLNQLVKDFEYDADIRFNVFMTHPDLCKERDAARTRSVGNDVIDKMYENFVQLLDGKYDFTTRPKKSKTFVNQEFDSSKSFCYVFDIDGTLAHMTNRGPFEWKRVGEDVADVNVCATLKLLSQNAKILVVSGRDEVCRPETEQWLEQWLGFCPALFMRPAGNFEKDNKIKRRIYENDILPHFNVLGVFDDRQQVVDELRDMGLKVFQVQEGDF